jgi:hypothetical protein
MATTTIQPGTPIASFGDSFMPSLSDTADIQTALKALYFGTTGAANTNNGIYGALHRLYIGSPTLAGVVTLGAQSSQFAASLILTDSTHTTSRRAGIQLGSQWQVGQDSTGTAVTTGTRDFYIFGHNAQRVTITPDGAFSVLTNSLNIGTAATNAAYRIQASAPNAGMGLVSTSSTGGSWIDFVNGSTVRSNIHYNYGTEVLSFGTTTPGIGGTRVDRMGIGNFGISVSGNVQYNLQTLETGTATLTAADILTRNIYVSSGTFSLTLDTGTNFDSALTAPSIGTTIEWVVMNDGTGTITVQSGTGHTLRGSGTVSATSAARFITRKTGTNFYVTYRL